MASVQNVHKYLTQTYLGHAGKQLELDAALRELRDRKAANKRVPRLSSASSPKVFDQRQSYWLSSFNDPPAMARNVSLLETSESADVDNNEEADARNDDPFTVNSGDRLYRMYTDSLRHAPHTFERIIGDLNCVIHTNTPLERANLVVVFLHGLGASPWHFFRVATLFHEELTARRLSNETPADIKIAFIFPFAPHSMEEHEFGAVPDCVYGSFKWWDIFNLVEKLHSGNEEIGKKRSPGSNFPQPTIIRDAHPSPRIFTSSESLAQQFRRPEAEAFNSPDAPVVTPEQRAAGCCCRGGPASTEKKTDDLMAGTSLERPLGREEATEKVLGLLTALEEKWRIPLSRIALCGFSQGAMLTLDLLHYLPRPPAMAAVFSAAPMCVDLWKARQGHWTPAIRKQFLAMPLLQSHGTKDWVFPIFVGRWLHRFLERQGWSVKNVEFDGDHELPEDVVIEFHKTLYQLAANEPELIEGFHTDLKRPALSGVIDDFMYHAGYAFAACLLPVARKLF